MELSTQHESESKPDKHTKEEETITSTLVYSEFLFAGLLSGDAGEKGNSDLQGETGCRCPHTRHCLPK